MPIQSLATPIRALENGHFTGAQALSLSLHLALIALLLMPVAITIQVPSPPDVTEIFSSRSLAPLKWKRTQAKAAGKFGIDGGSGHKEPDPPSKGNLPPFSSIQLMQPGPIVNQKALITLPPTILGPEDARLEQILGENWGIPNEREVNNSRGPGEGGSYGRGKGKGSGDRTGDGFDGEGAPYAGKEGHGSPVCAYCPNPPFSEEAIRVRYQGTVVLRALVTADGRVTNISVVRGLGMGLDENAIAKVRTWRLTPARGPGGQPAAVWTLIEVIFRQH